MVYLRMLFVLGSQVEVGIPNVRGHLADSPRLPKLSVLVLLGSISGKWRAIYCYPQLV